MNLRRTFAATATAVALTASGAFTATTASAATQNLVVDCEGTSTIDFTLAEGDIVIFDVGSVICTGSLTVAMNLMGGANQTNFATLIASIANLSGTGGTAVADWAAKTVTYTAGPNPGTDSIVMTNYAFVRAVSLSPRLGAPGVTTLNMTVPGSGGDGPAPQWEMYGRSASDTCPTGWGNSWAQWPNGNTGGFVCVREYYYNTGTGRWAYR